MVRRILTTKRVMFDEPGDTFEGGFVGFGTVTNSSTGEIWDTIKLMSLDGIPCETLSTFALAEAFEQVEPGAHVGIEFLGSRKTKRGGQDLKEFVVWTDE